MFPDGAALMPSLLLGADNAAEGALAFFLNGWVMRKRFYILSIDGGGLKGLIAVKILRIIEDFIQENISGKFDLLAGTSTGGLIAAALATGNPQGEPLYDLAHLESLYMEIGKNVFMQGGISVTGKETGKFDAMLKQTFGDTRLSQTLKPLFIPTYDVGAGKIIGFKTRSALQDPSKDLLLTDVCRATSAIPPVFPSYTLKYHGRTIHCLDAGSHLKNPALSALAEVFKHREYYGPVSEEDIVLLSISTGSHVSGSRDWTTDINEILHTQRSDMDYIAEQSLHINFRKVHFLRADLKLGGSPFSLAQLLEWMSRINALAENRSFREDVMSVLS
jgi:predicted acylesterase/phospholipase RssA